MKKILFSLLLSIGLLIALGYLMRAPTSHAADAITSSPPTPPRKGLSLTVDPTYSLTPISQFGGSVNTAVLSGDRAYTMIGPRLTSLDISDPANPALLGQTSPLSPTIGALEATDDRVVGSAWGMGIYVFDVTDPTQPRLTGSYTGQEILPRFALTGTFVYAQRALTDTVLLDISPPDGPQAIKTLPDLPGFGDVAIDGNLMWMAGEDMINVYDITEPITPSFVLSYTTPVDHISVDGDYAYVSWQDSVWGPLGAIWFGNLRILDISEFPTFTEVFLMEGFPGLPSQLRDMEYLNGKLYGYDVICSRPSAPCWYYFEALDVSNPVNPTLDVTDLYNLSSYSPYWYLVDVSLDNIALTMPDQVLLFDPATDSQAGAYQTWFGDDIHVENKQLYLADRRKGLLAMDVSNPVTPTIAGQYPAPFQSYGGLSFNELSVYGPYAYSSVAIEGTGISPLTILDLSTTSRITHVQILTASWNLIPEVIHRGIGFNRGAGNFGGYVQLLNLETITQPITAGRTLELGNLQGFTVHDQHLYEIHLHDIEGLRIYNIADPYTPIFIRTFLIPSPPYQVASGGNVLYIVTDNELVTFDITIPDSPVETGQLPFPATGIHSVEGLLRVYGTIAFIAEPGTERGLTRLTVYEAKNPAQPIHELTTHQLPMEEASDIEFDGEYVYVNSASGGMFVLRLETQYPQYAKPIFLPMGASNFTPVPVGAAIAYQPYVQGQGWLDWGTDGEAAGTAGSGQQMEALRIELGSNLPPGIGIAYQGHVMEVGWMDWVYDGDTIGIPGSDNRLEAVRLKLLEAPEGASLSYQVYVEGLGWMPPVSEGEIAGTTGEARRLEAIRITLLLP